MLKNTNGWYLQSHELLPMLGIASGCHLPVEGFGPLKVQGVTFKCEPAAAPRYNSMGRRVKVSKHRVKYLCEECNRWVPFGRAGQHTKGSGHMHNAGRAV